ncbi:AraC family transcriptional regulator [Paenibacillus ehimensis]|uniref:AraC family transcriptional regulator n=1 Tax=Paenibacillus ehimensis TaxID=79264 RepID=UPI000FDCB109|nr:AraC family transcriptional regulator [Paenibacillus ehimensis]
MMQKMNQYVDTQTSSSHKNVSDLILYNCGTENCDPNYSFGPIARDFHLIHFVVKGRGKLSIDNETYPIKENQAFLIPANKIAFYQADAQDPWEYCWVGFMGIQSEYYLQHIAVVNGGAYVINVENANDFYMLIQTMLDISGASLSSSLFIQGYLYHILAMLVSAGKTISAVHRGSLSYALQAMNYLDKNYSNTNVQIHAIADFLGLHPNYLSTIFKQDIGVTPKEYLIQLRMKKACELLQQTSYPIHIISNSVGYADPLTFSRAFKTVTGMSPKAYRESSRLPPESNDL